MFRGSKHTKTCLILVIFLFSITSTAIQTEAGPISRLTKLYHCEPFFKVEYNKTSLEEPITPLSEPREIPVRIGCMINGLFADIVADTYSSYEVPLFVNLYVEETPEWCTATVTPPLIYMPISSTWHSENATVFLTLKENAPAFEQAKIKIRIRSDSVGKRVIIPEGNTTLDIPFRTGYIPIISLSVPEGNYKIISPYDTARFKIDVENLGNEKTELTSYALNVPDGWTVTITSNTVLDSKARGGNPKKSIELDVKPPYGFGYHEDRQVIQVSITPSYYNDPTLRGEEHILSFIVLSRGFSTPGFETLFTILTFMGIVLINKRRRQR
ncbi:MAG TPA: hypothetical protein ENL13_04065 [Thermoplasmatales archaeon]|nr:hypothetical protein [Thermoplasmatales archaeon]